MQYVVPNSLLFFLFVFLLFFMMAKQIHSYKCRQISNSSITTRLLYFIQNYFVFWYFAPWSNFLLPYTNSSLTTKAVELTIDSYFWGFFYLRSGSIFVVRRKLFTKAHIFKTRVQIFFSHFNIFIIGGLFWWIYLMQAEHNVWHIL